MGMTKRFQEEKTKELADKLGIEELYFYEEGSLLAAMASAYTQYKLVIEEGHIQEAYAMVRMTFSVDSDKAIDLIQRMLESACGDADEGSCASCKFSPLCLEYWEQQYKTK